MKILFLYPNNEGYFRCPVGLTLIMTILKKEGHEIKLFDTTFMAADDNLDSELREKNGSAKPIVMDHFFDKHTERELISKWIQTIKEFKPDLIAASILEDAYEFCSLFIDAVKKDFDIPIAVGGVTPTISPNVIMEHPNIDFAIQGEGEVAFKELVDALENKTPLSEVGNLWYKDKENDEVVKNKLVKYMDMNKLPNQDIDIWDDKHFLKPYNGKMYRTGFFEMSRGCMHKCHYCFNRYMQVGLAQSETGKYRRNKSFDTIIREVLELHKKKNFELLMFTDDNFLARPYREMEEFYERWSKEVKIPYWINTCIETINEDNLPLLKKSNCVGIGVGMETGSEWVRRNILKKGKMTNQMYYDGFKMMADHKIRSTCNVMIGFPGEFEGDVFETIKLNKKIRAIHDELTSCAMSYVAPYAGTVIHNICLDLGLIEVNYQPGFRGLCKEITMRREPVIVNPSMSKEKIIELHYSFADYINGKKEIPKEYLETDVDRKYAIGAEHIYSLYEQYTGGPVNIDTKKFMNNNLDNFNVYKNQSSLG